MGTTSEKLTYLNTTKNLIKEELNLGGANITNEPFRAYKDKLEGIYKDFLANGTDTLWNNWEKVSGSGTEISLNNTIEAKMDFVYKGNTSQKTTTGKNLFNSIYYKNQEIYTETISISTGNLYCTKLYLKPNTTYTISEALNNWSLDGGWIFVVADTNNQIIRFLQNRQQDYQTTPTTFTTNSEGYVYIGHRYGFAEGTTDRMLAFLDTVNIQIEEGNTATSFEEYTGGIASPNPDYPQDIQVVSGDNTIKVEGKNLFDKSNTNVINGFINASSVIKSSSNDRIIYIPCKANTTYSVQKMLQVTTSKNRFSLGTTEAIPTLETIVSQCYKAGDGTTTTSYTITTKNTSKYLVFFCYSNDTETTFNEMLNSIQIEISDEPTTYEAYKGASYPVSLGNIELCKIGIYQDYIYKNSGKWYLYKKISKITLSNSDNFILDSYSQRFTKVLDTTYEKEGYSNRYIYGGTYQTTGKFEILNNGRLAFSYPSSNIDTVAKLQTYLTTNELYMYLPLLNSTTTEITDTTLISQLEAIKKSYNTQTNISQTNDDKPFILDVVALGELT